MNEAFKDYDISTPKFSLDGYKSHCRIVDIIDGDTLIVVLPLFGTHYKFNVRLNGIDTSELKSKDKSAYKARERVFEIVCKNKCEANTRKYIQNYLKNNVIVCWIECSKFDKYGRLLGNISIENKYVSVILLEENLAKPYDGGTKINWVVDNSQ